MAIIIFLAITHCGLRDANKMCYAKNRCQNVLLYNYVSFMLYTYMKYIFKKSKDLDLLISEKFYYQLNVK